jgi:hypothetical protein
MASFWNCFISISDHEGKLYTHSQHRETPFFRRLETLLDHFGGALDLFFRRVKPLMKLWSELNMSVDTGKTVEQNS